MKQYHDTKGNPFASLSPAVWRASTVVFDNFEDFVARKSRQPDGYSYGLTGTPTNRELERAIAELEGAKHCVGFPSGQAALMATVMAFVRGGDHLLISESCYGALKTFGKKWLSQMGVDVEFFPPAIGGEIQKFLKTNTKMICMESPGTVTMEMQDVDAITSIAKRNDILTMIDNTWASPLFFKPLEHGVDFSIESGTKMFGGHSDLLYGSVSLNNFDQYSVLRETQSILGLNCSPEDCLLVLRGMETFELRLRKQSASTLKIAYWISQQPQVKKLFYPPYEGDPGYPLWKKQFTGSGPLFSFSFAEDNEKAIAAFFNNLKMFSIGASWGGTRSLIGFYPASLQKAREFSPTQDALVRVAIGVEDPQLLINDLKNALLAWESAL